MAGLDDGEDRAEDLLLSEAGRGAYVCHDRRSDVVPILGVLNWTAPIQNAPLCLCDLKVTEDLVVRLWADNRTGVDVLRRISGLDLVDAGLQAVAEDVVYDGVEDCARTCRDLLSVETEGAGDHSLDGEIKIGVGVDDDRVLASHLEDGAFDEGLAG